MVSNYDKWIRIFDVTDTSQHKKGFTIYKVISMLYPEECPDAVTKITVWKRYNEFKKLYRDLKSKHRNLHFNDRFPTFPNNPFFKRFDKAVINERKEAILKLLEYIAKHPELFTCNEFVKFFETSHTPSELLSGSINSIRADLHLPAEPEYVSFHPPNSEDEHTLSDTDSISTLSSLSPSVQAADLLSDPLYKSTTSLTRLSRKVNIESPSNISQLKNSITDLHDSISISTVNESIPVVEDSTSFTPPSTPSFSSTEASPQYIVDAANFITQATEMEVIKEHEMAFSAYKHGIDVLLKNVKFDKDINRREMVRHKVEKYLLRAEKIYNIYLSPEIRNIQELTKVDNEPKFQRPLADLYKYKVIKVIASGMLVIHSESQQLFYIKVIYKTWKFSNDNLILPDNVPYMVKLFSFYNCENALFLVLQYCCGIKLLDYLKQKYHTDDFLRESQVQLFKDNIEVNSDNESEGSYADLVNDYAAAKKQDASDANLDKDTNERLNLRNSEIVKFNAGINARETKIVNCNNNLNEDGLNGLEINDILTKSQELLSSVDFTLSANVEISNQTSSAYGKPIISKETGEININKVLYLERKSSDRSLYEDFDVPENPVNVHDIVKWSAQLLLALEKLHIVGVICCDLDFKNLLINENGDLMLTYMCSLTEDKKFNSKTDLIIAPELYGFESISAAVDWWSYGAILYELLVGLPLKSVHPEGVFSYTSLKIPKFVAPEGKSLLKQLLAYEQHHRLGYGVNGTEDIKSHPFFSTISWECLRSKYSSQF